MCFVMGHKINSPDIFVVLLAFNKYRVKVVINIVFEFFKILFFNSSETVMDETEL